MRWAICVVALGLAACASLRGASDQQAPFASPTQAPAAATDYPIPIDLAAGDYRLDPRHASVVFRIRHMNLSWFTARFDHIEALFSLDSGDPSRSRIAASVAADSVDTGVRSRSGERAFDHDIGAALGAESTPQIAFTSTGVERTGEHTARVTGDLTMNGQTHPATLDVTFAGAAVDPLRGGRQVIAFSAYTTIDRSQWGVDEWTAFTGNDVQVVIEAEFIKS